VAVRKTKKTKQNLLASQGIKDQTTSILFALQKIEELASASGNQKHLPRYDSAITNTEELERFLHFRRYSLESWISSIRPPSELQDPPVTPELKH